MMEIRIQRVGMLLFAILFFGCTVARIQSPQFVDEHQVLQSKEYKLRIPAPFHLQKDNYNEGVIYFYSFVDSVYIIVFQGSLMEFAMDNYNPLKTEITEDRRSSSGIKNNRYWRKDVIGTVRVYYNNATIKKKDLYDAILNNIEITPRRFYQNHVSRDSSKQVSSTDVESKNDDFVKLVLENKNGMSDSVRVLKVIDGAFFEQSSSTATEYIWLFNYVDYHENEEFDEAISQHLYEMFSKYPVKFNEFDSYLKKMAPREQTVIMNFLATALSYSYLSFCDLDCSEDNFFLKFPYFEKRIYAKLFQEVKDNM